MNRFSIFLLPLSLVFPFEKPATLILVLFFLTEILSHYKEMKSRVNFKMFLHPLVVLFVSSLIFMKLRPPVGGWDRDLSLFLFPFYFSLRKLSEEEINSILKGFVWFLFLGLLFSVFYEFILEFFYKDYINVWKLKEHYNNSQLFYFIHSVSERIKFHHIYFSLYLFVGFLIGHYLIFSNLLKDKKEILFTKYCMIVFLLFTILSVSRMSIICFTFYGLFYFSLKIRRAKFFIIIIPFIILLLAFPSSIKSRFSRVLEVPRLSLFNLSIDLSKQSFLFGYGSQEGQIKFIAEQQKLGNEVIYGNSHNQFLDYLLGGGFIMVLVFIMVFAFLIKKYYKSKMYIGIIICSFFIFQCLTEALFERYRGIVLFSFLSSLFYYMSSKEYEKKSKKNTSFYL